MGASPSTELGPQFEAIKQCMKRLLYTNKGWLLLFAIAGPWTRAASVMRTYSEGEYDFGIEESVVVAITGVESGEARELIAAHSRNDNGMWVSFLVSIRCVSITVWDLLYRINALTLMISIIALADSSKRNESNRLFAVFDLFDFSKANAISYDELVCFDFVWYEPELFVIFSGLQTILIICVGQSFSYILTRPPPFTDAHACKWSSAIYAKLGKKPTSSINKVTFILMKYDFNWLCVEFIDLQEELQSWATFQLWKNNVFTVNAILDVLKMDPAELVPTEGEGENSNNNWTFASVLLIKYNRVVRPTHFKARISVRGC